MYILGQTWSTVIFIRLCEVAQAWLGSLRQFLKCSSKCIWVCPCQAVGADASLTNEDLVVYVEKGGGVWCREGGSGGAPLEGECPLPTPPPHPHHLPLLEPGGHLRPHHHQAWGSPTCLKGCRGEALWWNDIYSQLDTLTGYLKPMSMMAWPLTTAPSLSKTLQYNGMTFRYDGLTFNP